MRVGQTSIIYFVSKLGGSLLGFVATVYFARILGEEILGFYALVLALVTWFTLPGDIGLTGAVAKRISEGTDQNEYATAGIVVIAIMGSIIAVGIFLFEGFINEYVGRDIAFFILLVTFVVLFRSLFFSILQGHHLVHIYAPLSTVKLGIRSGTQILLVFVGLGLTGLLVGYVAGGMFAILASIIVLKFHPSIPQREHFISLYEYAKFSWLGSLRGRTFDQVDIAVLGFFVSAGLIGVYSVAWTLSKFLDIFGNAISTTLFPEMSELAAKNDPKSISGLVEDALGFGGLIIIPGFVGGTVLADRLMQIYGEGFVIGQRILPILIAALLVYTYNKQLLNTLNAIDRPDLAFRANAAFISTNILLNVLLVWQIGWVGAALATALSAVIGLVFAFCYARNHVDFLIPYREISRQWIAALCMGAVVYLARSLGEANLTWVDEFNVVFVLLLVSLGAAVYFVLLLGISSTFRTTVTNNLPFAIPLLDR